jgi:quercetin dioxygenase-like cupin family protein
MKTKVLVLFATALGAFLLGGVVVAAAIVPPSGFHPKIIADGKIAKASEIDAHGIEFSSRKNARVIVQTVEFDGGGKSGWHTHPGLTVVTVVDGSVIDRSGCDAPVVYTANQSFVEPANTPGSVENVSATVKAHAVATLIVPDGMDPRTNVEAPDCSDPSDELFSD